MISSKLTMALGAVVAAVVILTAFPGGRESSGAPAGEISIDDWERIAFEHQDASYAKELIGQTVRHPELVRALEAEGITPEAFRKAGESALRIHLERIAAEESTFEFAAERPGGESFTVILDRDGFEDEGGDGFGLLMRRIQAGVARQYLESSK